MFTPALFVIVKDGNSQTFINRRHKQSTVAKHENTHGVGKSGKESFQMKEESPKRLASEREEREALLKSLQGGKEEEPRNGP